jgi:hypothetical protein
VLIRPHLHIGGYFAGTRRSVTCTLENSPTASGGPFYQKARIVVILPIPVSIMHCSFWSEIYVPEEDATHLPADTDALQLETSNMTDFKPTITKYQHFNDVLMSFGIGGNLEPGGIGTFRE